MFLGVQSDKQESNILFTYDDNIVQYDVSEFGFEKCFLEF